MKLAPLLATLLVAAPALADDIRCRSRVVFPANQLAITVPFEKTRNGIFVKARVNGRPDALSFVIDSGAARTLISESAAKRVGVRGTEKTMLRGAGAGVIPVMVAKNVAIDIDVVKIDRIDLRITNLEPLKPIWGRAVDGIIGFDLLCRSTMTVDYDASRLTLTHPAVFKFDGRGEALPLVVRNGWPFVQGTIKVTGRPAVIDNFLIDSGSQDAVNHPIIRDSKGPLRPTRTGVGLGIQMSGVFGPNEWFKLGQYTIGSTNSACCSESEETSRQIGGEVLSKFRVTFDYPHKRLILERRTR